MTRRKVLQQFALGFGGLALADLLAREAHGRRVLRDQGPHHPPKARSVIFLFMHGGPSTLDLFDYKPALARLDGRPLPIAKPRLQFAPTGNLLASPWRFQRHGQSGAWVSELLPHLAGVVDDLCFVKSLHGTNPAHAAAAQKLMTGSATFIRPSLGAWTLYGLGTANRELPAFISICPDPQAAFLSGAFLPADCQGTPLGTANCPPRQIAMHDVNNPSLDLVTQRRHLDLLRRMNERHPAAAEDTLEARTASFELAFRMQTAAPQALSLDGETPATRGLYGLEEPRTAHFGHQCLLARRLVERGVRFVQCTHTYKWDAHSGLRQGHESAAGEIDRPVAGLIRDLKARGLLEQTLVLWAGEFGRTPVAQGKDGRDHNPEGFTVFLAGGGIKGGISHGATDDFGYYAEQDKVSLPDLHATILHVLGLDHERLTFRHAGRDFRLTDVEGRVVRSILG
jgi:hypothetical protein